MLTTWAGVKSERKNDSCLTTADRGGEWGGEEEGERGKKQVRKLLLVAFTVHLFLQEVIFISKSNSSPPPPPPEFSV